MKHQYIHLLGAVAVLLILWNHFAPVADEEEPSPQMLRRALSESEIVALPDSLTYSDMLNRFGYGTYLSDRFMVQFENGDKPDELIFFCYHPLFEGDDPDLLQVFTSAIGGEARQLWKNSLWTDSYTEELLQKQGHTP